MFEEGIRYAPESSTKLNIYVNDPLHMFGSPITTDIFLSPQKKPTSSAIPFTSTTVRK